jgi:hypothetical protein
MKARKKEKYGSRNKQVKIAHSQICQLNREALAGSVRGEFEKSS